MLNPIDTSRVYAEINLDNLRKNIKVIKNLAKSSKIIAIVKADAYGHGAKEIVRVMHEEGINMFGVASLEEALEIKAKDRNIIILSPPACDSIPQIIENDFIITIVDYGLAEEVNEFAKLKNKSARVHIKVDTGMSRLGIPISNAKNTIEKILQLDHLKIEGIMTHLAEPIDKEFTRLQVNRFRELISNLKRDFEYIHAENSTALILQGDAIFNTIRPGILFYGLYPDNRLERNLKVYPILSIKARVAQVKNIDRGASVGYGRTFITDVPRKIAIVTIGYADGYPRSLSNRGKVLIKGKFCQILGTVCMDMIAVDVTDVDVNSGDIATIIGKDGGYEISCEELATLADTIPYEITTRVSIRVPRVYIENNKIISVTEINRKINKV